MLPGQHLIVIGSETDALSARAAGLTLRDSLLILTPGPRTLTAFLFRQPPEGTIAENVLKHQHGGLNIDACRIGYGAKSLDEVRKEAGSPGRHSSKCQMDYEGGWGPRGDPIDFHPSGRWPTNLVLVHSPHCKQTGTKSVNVTPSRWKHYTETPKTSNNTYAQDAWTKEHFMTSGVTHDANGQETVPNWTCSPDCPVRLLDEMSGERTSGMMVAGQLRKDSYGKGGYHDGFVTPASQHGTYGDKGAASRFYPQFPSLQDALHWLATLISPPST